MMASAPGDDDDHSPVKGSKSLSQMGHDRRMKNFACLHRRREIQEDGWRYFSRKVHVTHSMVNNIGLLKALDGHCGCVNCIEFNEEGSLLLSGSDDFSIIVWDVHKRRSLTTLTTGHRGNIFSVKFMPETGDSAIVSGAADCRVEVQQLPSGEVTQVCTCHTQRVKRIATIPSSPSLFLTASEDGTVMQFDTRTKHVCSSQPNNVLINLKQHAGKIVECKCVTVNPLRSELVAVGASDPYVRIYDRRMIKLTSVQYPPGGSNRSLWERENYAISQMDPSQDNLSPGCVQYFVPGHLPSKMKDYYKRNRSLATTYLCYSMDGSHLLANLGGDHIYLFDTFNADTPKQYSIPAKNGLSSSSSPKVKNGRRVRNGVSSPTKLGNILNISSCSCANHMQSGENATKENLPRNIEKLRKVANEAFEFQDYTRALDLYNHAIEGYEDSPSLYIGRAAARMKRQWDGDVYASLRDCDLALNLDPSNIKAQCRQIQCLHLLGRSFEARQNFDEFQRQYVDLKLYECSAWSDLKEWISTPITTRGNETATEEDKKEEERLIALSQPATSLEKTWREAAKDYDKVYCGHCNTTTDIKEAVFFGKEGQFIAAGSDDGNLFIWDRKTTNLVRVIDADTSIVNCVQSHPNICMLATSGIESVVKLWGPVGSHDDVTTPAPPSFTSITSANQHRMSTDPNEMMILQMGDFSHALMSRSFLISNGPAGAELLPRFAVEDDDSGQQNLQCRPS